MLELYFFILGLVNSVFLIFVFLIRKNRSGHSTKNRMGISALGDSCCVWHHFGRARTENSSI